MDKVEIRKQMIEKLKHLVEIPQRKKQKESQIYAQLFSSDYWQKSEVIAITLSNAIELNTEPIIERGYQEGKIMVVPKTLPKRKMEFYKIDQTTVMELSAFGVREPLSNEWYTKETIDLILVPGLAFSPSGYRIGFGGGYYDRYLSDYQNKTVSLVFSEQFNDTWIQEEFDCPVDKIFTDK